MKICMCPKKKQFWFHSPLSWTESMYERYFSKYHLEKSKRACSNDDRMFIDRMYLWVVLQVAADSVLSAVRMPFEVPIGY